MMHEPALPEMRKVTTGKLKGNEDCISHEVAEGIAEHSFHSPSSLLWKLDYPLPCRLNLCHVVTRRPCGVELLGEIEE